MQQQGKAVLQVPQCWLLCLRALQLLLGLSGSSFGDVQSTNLDVWGCCSLGRVCVCCGNWMLLCAATAQV